MKKMIKYAQVGRTLFSWDPLPQGVIPTYFNKPSWQEIVRQIIDEENILINAS